MVDLVRVKLDDQKIAEICEDFTVRLAELCQEQAEKHKLSLAQYRSLLNEILLYAFQLCTESWLSAQRKHAIKVFKELRMSVTVE